MKVKVNSPFQVAHAEARYLPGDVAEVPDEVAHRWLSCGWVTEHASPVRKATVALEDTVGGQRLTC
jgi:hypothetical protein